MNISNHPGWTHRTQPTQTRINTRTYPSQVRQYKIYHRSAWRIRIRNVMTGDSSQRNHPAGELLHAAHAWYLNIRIHSTGNRNPAVYSISQKDTAENQNNQTEYRSTDDIHDPEMTEHRMGLLAYHGHVPARLRRQHGKLPLLHLTRNSYWLLIYLYKKKGLRSPFQISNCDRNSHVMINFKFIYRIPLRGKSFPEPTLSARWSAKYCLEWVLNGSCRNILEEEDRSPGLSVIGSILPWGRSDYLSLWVWSFLTWSQACSLLS